jgi:hypothetical protein
MGRRHQELHLHNEQDALFLVGPAAEFRLDKPILAPLAPCEDVDWLWNDRIPVGQVTLIEGAPRAGKSFVVQDLAARVTTGAAWPDRDSAPRAPEKCLFIGRQESAGNLLARRLELAGADPERLCHFARFKTIDSAKRSGVRPVNFPGDLPALELFLENQPEVKLVVIDPLSDVGHSGDEAAETLHRLNEIAANCAVAIVVTQRAAVQFDARGQLKVKSRWPTDAARCTWCVAVDCDSESERLFVPTRMNFRVEPQGLRFTIAAGRIEWNVAEPVDSRDPARSLSGCGLWLSELLEVGDIASREVYRLGAELGYTVDMLKYAKKRIGAHRRRVGGFTSAGYWMWSRHAEPTDQVESTPQKMVVSLNRTEERADSPADQTAKASEAVAC